MIDPHRLFAHKLGLIYKSSTTTFITHCFWAVALVAFLRDEVSSAILVGWFCVALVGGVFGWFVGRHYLHQLHHYGEPESLVPHFVAAGVAGLSFGVTALLLPYLALPGQVFLMILLAAVAAGALPRLAALPTAYAVYLLTVLLPVMIVLVVRPGEIGGSAIAALLVLMLSLLLAARDAHVELLELLRARFGLESEAGEDKLTRIANRRRFDMTLELEWRRAMRDQVPLSLIMLDVDFFKQFNDRYGHQDGDKCLSQVARTLKATAKRASDLVARYGGEEFVVLLYHTNQKDAFDLAEQIRSAIAAHGLGHRDSPFGCVTASLGGATVLPNERTSPQNLVLAADRALYRAKANGRNRVEWTESVGRVDASETHEAGARGESAVRRGRRGERD